MVSRITLTDGGLSVSRIIPGLMRLPEWGLNSAELVNWIEACLDMGLTTFDHADIYGGYICEGLFGEALALKPSLRQKMEIVTKCGIKMVHPNRPDYQLKTYDTTNAHIIASAENSLKMLNTDSIDLLLIHRPDPLMDADEVADTFTTLKQAGKVQHFGVSNFTPSQFDLLQSRLSFPLVTNQVEFSPLHLGSMYDGTFDQCQRLRIAPMIWSPLGGGGLFRPHDDRTQRLHNTLQGIADSINAGVDQVVLAWVMAHPVNVLPVIGTGKLERIRAAANANDIQLSRDQWFAILEASTGHEVP